ncbi:7183_t:CDS:1, partial [Funneliformis geosporum]
ILTITYLMSSQDKPVIVDSEKVLTRPIIALPLSASNLVFSHIWEKMPKTLIVTNGNGFYQKL